MVATQRLSIALLLVALAAATAPSRIEARQEAEGLRAPEEPQAPEGPAAGTAARPLAAWERAAVELAVAYADGGAEAWWPLLAPGSPLERLGRTAAVAEIEVRAGPARGAHWRLATPTGRPRPGRAAFTVLYPSGLDELLLLELEPQGAGWKLARLTSWAEPAAAAEAEPTGPPAGGRALGAAVSAGAAADADSRVIPELGLPLAGDPWPVLVLAFALLGLLALGLAARRRRAPALVALVLLAAGVALVLEMPDEEPAMAPPAPGTGPEADRIGDGFSRLAALLPLRRALTASEADQDASPLPEPEAGSPAAGSPAAAVGRLWRAQHLLAAGDPEAAQAELDRAGPGLRPLAEILRARLGLLRGKEAAAMLALERASRALPALDAPALEAAEIEAALGFEERMRQRIAELANAGSRRAAAHYHAARIASLDGDQEQARARFVAAWELEPLERSQLLADRMLAPLVRHGDLFARLELGRAREPVVVPDDAGRQALVLPAGFDAAYCGRSLVIRGASAEIEIPGGVRLAPLDARPESSESRRRRSEQRLLTGLPQLTAATRRPGGVTRPLVRHRATGAAGALARRRRWRELVDLTDGFAAQPQSMPTAIARLRTRALARAGHPERAARLLVQLAANHAGEHRRDPEALLQLADLLIELEDYERAERVAAAAEALSPLPPAVSRLPRIRLERELEASYATHQSRHFRLRYPATASRLQISRLTVMLEAELARLSRWLPAPPSQPIAVHLFPASDLARLTGLDGNPGEAPPGLYDGKVRLPLAEVVSLHPAAVAVVSHEIAHALVADATGGRAPSWFDEGLAQHVQMVHLRPNPIPAYRRRGKLLALPLLEPILDSYSDPELVAAAYDQAAWAVHYLERRHGLSAVHDLLAAFAQGLETEPALRRVLGWSLPRFDAAVWGWAESQPAWGTEVVRYDR